MTPQVCLALGVTLFFPCILLAWFADVIVGNDTWTVRLMMVAALGVVVGIVGCLWTIWRWAL